MIMIFLVVKLIQVSFHFLRASTAAIMHFRIRCDDVTQCDDLIHFDDVMRPVLSLMPVYFRDVRLEEQEQPLIYRRRENVSVKIVSRFCWVNFFSASLKNLMLITYCASY